MGIFSGSGLSDYGIGDLLGTRDRASRLESERRLLALILQAGNLPDLQHSLPGFSLPGIAPSERRGRGFFGGFDPLGQFLGLSGEGGEDAFAPGGGEYGGGYGGSLRHAMVLDQFLEPKVFRRKASTRGDPSKA